MTQRKGEQVAEWVKAEEGWEMPMSKMRVESCLAVAEVGATDSEKETTEIPSLAKDTSMKQ